MGENEEATLRTLSSHRKLIDSLIEQHHGRFVNPAGDSVLAEFASVVNAVECAVETQTALKAENTSLPPERRMDFRIVGRPLSPSSNMTRNRKSRPVIDPALMTPVSSNRRHITVPVAHL